MCVCFLMRFWHSDYVGKRVGTLQLINVTLWDAGRCVLHKEARSIWLGKLLGGVESMLRVCRITACDDISADVTRGHLAKHQCPQFGSGARFC